MAYAPLLTLRDGALACIAFALCQPAIWARLSEGYAGDDFFTLSGINQVLLAVISLMMIALTCLTMAGFSQLILRTTRPVLTRVAVDVGIRAGLFGLLIWLSPQVYYSFYRLIIPSLPNQWVIRWPSVDGILTGLAVAADGRLASHVIAAVFWGLLIAGVLRQTRSQALTVLALFLAALSTSVLRSVI